MSWINVKDKLPTTKPEDGGKEMKIDLSMSTMTKQYPKRPKWLFHLLPRGFVELPRRKGFWLFGKKFYTGGI